MSYLIETKGLIKIFRPSLFFKRKQTIALNNVNLQVKEGELFVLVGQNGAGKTTLLKILCGLILPTSGKVYINGGNIFNNRSCFRKKIGFVSGEERSFYWRLTGKQNLEFFGRLYDLSKKEIYQKINELVEIMALKEEINKQFRHFSAGAKQRLALVRALLHNPLIIFMDEPTRSLDPLAQNKLREFIKNKLVKEDKKTLFITTHNLNEAEFLADRLAIIEKGQIKVCGTLDELRIQFNTNKLEEIYGNIVELV
ncbi:MAG: ABC transporter ATP-binding protein [Candidatus Omnitrophota bacterium]